MKKVLYLAAAAALLFSCQKEIDSFEEAQNDNFSFKVTIEELSAPTKAEMNDTYDLVWKTDDKIAVHATGWNDEPFTLVGAGGSSSADFTWDNGTEFSPNAIAAFFPYGGGNNYSETNSAAYFTLPYSYSGYTSGKMLTPLVASLTSSTDVINFQHAAAAIKVTINNLPAGAHSIGMSVAGQPINGYFHVAKGDFGTKAIELNGTDTFVNKDDPNSVWINFEPLAAEQAFTFVFPVPALTTPQLSFAIYDKNDIEVWSKNVKAQANNLGRADVLVMPAVSITPYPQFDAVSSYYVHGSFDGTNWTDKQMITDGIHSIIAGVEFTAAGEFKVTNGTKWYPDSNVPVSAGTYDIIFDETSHNVTVQATGECAYPTSAMPHHTSIKGATELGATEHANCYIITAPGSYKIKAVKGNSTEKAGDVAGVELLWETYNNATDVVKNSVIAAVDYDADDTDYIYFKTPATLQSGNALIAAKDATGAIIWSWHIWIPETAIETSTYGYIYNHELMDRNLGALVAATTSSVPVESYGLLYEWGRKDPFVGAKSITSSSFATVSGSATTKGYEMTMAQTIANPTVYAVYTAADSWGNWTNETGASTFWKNAEKTIYDPCPAGYRVPARDAAQLLHQSDLSSVKGWSDNAASGTNAAYFTLGNPATVFPFTGLLSEDGSGISYNGSGQRNFIWTAYASSSSGSGYMMDVRQGTSTHTVTSTVTSRGCSVRCVKVEEAPAPPEPDKVGATGVVLNGNFDDWSGADAISNSGSIKEWKYGYNDDYLCFYFKIVRSDIIAGKDDAYVDGMGYSFAWRRYIYIAIDTDNNATTGTTVTSGGLGLEGSEVKAIVYPFRGYSTSNSGTDGSTVVNGEDANGYIECPVGTKDGKIVAFGTIDDNYGYLEIGIPRNKIGSPTLNKMKVQFSLSSNTTGQQVISF